MKVLIVEDDRELAEMIRVGLASRSNTVEVAADGVNGSFLGRSFDYDAIVLDYSLPKKDGLTVCKEIRASGKKTPIIFLTVANDMDTKIAAFEKGADDYITKPFSLEELYARLHAVARRPQPLSQTILEVGDLMINSEKNIATRGKTALHLTRKEFNLLEFLMKHQGTIQSRAMLMEHVWTADSNPFSNTVEAHVRNLRKKICVGGKPDLIANIQGRGYVIDTPENLRRHL
jgi:two-component system OmpR family response regulator